MDCDFRRNFYLISNGEVNCGRDEPGYDLRVRIHDSNGGVDFSRWEKRFSAVSKKLANKKVPFDKSVTCKLLWPASFYEGSHSRKMRTIVVEPTVLCNISCTNCTPIKQRKYLREETKSGKLYLSEDILLETLQYLKGSDVCVENVEFQGFGEPLLVKKLPDLVEIGKKIYPEARMSLISNGISKSLNSELFEHLDYVIFSIDGVSQETYEPYRIMGNYRSTIENLEKVCLLKKKDSKYSYKVIWKYILFSHNCNREHLLEAARIAEQLGVDELRFIISEVGPVPVDFHRFGNQLNEYLFDPSLYCDQYESVKLEFAKEKANDLNIQNPFPDFHEFNLEVSMFNMISNFNNLQSALNIAEENLRLGDVKNARLLFRYIFEMFSRVYGSAGVNYSYILNKHSLMLSKVYALCMIHLSDSELREFSDRFLPILTLIKRSNSENCSDEVMPEFRLVPANHLTLEEDGSYVSIGNDPILSVFYNRLPTGDGFHQFQVKIDFEEYAKFDKGLEAQLFFDTGKGFNEEESVRAAYSEGIVTFLVPSINPVVALRLDPAETECKFTIVGFNCLSNDHKG